MASTSSGFSVNTDADVVLHRNASRVVINGGCIFRIANSFFDVFNKDTLEIIRKDEF